MDTPLVTCIVPVFNGELFLAETLDSIRGQTYAPIETIVVDDGSTDQTAAIATEHPLGARYLRQDQAGSAAARNTGIRAARGSLIAFLDADDLWVPEKTAKQVDRFRARPELGFCVGHAHNFWIPELANEAAHFANHRIAQPLPAFFTGALMTRAATFDAVGLFDTNYDNCDDTDWFVRAREAGVDEELLPDVLIRRRLHHRNHSRIMQQSAHDSYLRLIKTVLDRRRSGARPE